jgi:hypothetical protein
MDKRDLLREILQSTPPMDVPPSRVNLTDGDIRWLARNIGFRNQNHPRFREAVRLLHDLMPDALHMWLQE